VTTFFKKKKKLKLKEIKDNGVSIRTYDISKISEDDLMTRTQVADYLGVSNQTLANWALHQMYLPFFKIGHHVRYYKKNVKDFKDRYMDANGRRRIPRTIHKQKEEALFVMPTNFIMRADD
jgi:excisionase family DNA binding protein